MNQAMPTQGKNTLLEEYVGEIGPTPAEIAAALGQRRPAAAESPREAKGEPVAMSPNLDMVMRIPLDRRVGEPVDVVVNGRVVARGEVVVVDESTSRFGISLTEVVGASDSDRSTG
jgi:hypothetical protein